MRTRGWTAAVGVAAALLTLTGCGGGGKTSKAAAAPSSSIATTAPAPPQVKIQPPSGLVGTEFVLTATGMRQGAAVTFTITKPDGKVFTGGQHTVVADGTAAARYRTTNDPVGVYKVKATSTSNQTQDGSFEVVVPPTVAPSTTTAPARRRPTTTVPQRPTTTVKR